MIEEVDEDKSGEIEFIEFCTLMGKKLSEDELEEEMIDANKWMDKDQDGMIDAADMRATFVELGYLQP